MRVIPPEDLWIPELDAAVTKGHPVDVPQDVGERLVAQGWSRSKAKTAVRKTRPPKPTAGPPPGTKTED